MQQPKLGLCDKNKVTTIINTRDMYVRNITSITQNRKVCVCALCGFLRNGKDVALSHIIFNLVVKARHINTVYPFTYNYCTCIVSVAGCGESFLLEMKINNYVQGSGSSCFPTRGYSLPSSCFVFLVFECQIVSDCLSLSLSCKLPLGFATLVLSILMMLETM